MSETREIPQLPAEINGTTIEWSRWEPSIRPIAHIDTDCPTCAFTGLPVLSWGKAGDPALRQFCAFRCPACDETKIYERVPGWVHMEHHEVGYFPPRTRAATTEETQP